MTLNLTYAHVSGIHRNYFVIESVKTGLILLNQLGLESRLAISRDINLYLAIISGDGFAATTISRIPFTPTFQITFFVTQRQVSSAPKALYNKAFLRF